VREAVRSGALSSAHDVAEGGLAVALAECAIAGRLGAAISLGEGAAGILVSGPEAGLRALAERTQVRLIGLVGGGSAAEGGGRLRIELDGELQIDASVEQLAEAHREGIAGLFA